MQSGWHVLVVEDEPRMAETIRVYLEAEGHRVSLAHTAAMAGLRLKEAEEGGQPVDLMVLRDTHSDETEGETVLILQRDGEVDLSESLREFAALAYPQTTVCREDCRGLCATCGADLNDGPCGCVEEPVDPRWEGLP